MYVIYLHSGIYKIVKTSSFGITAFLFQTQLFRSPVYTFKIKKNPLFSTELFFRSHNKQKLTITEIPFSPLMFHYFVFFLNNHKLHYIKVINNTLLLKSI